MCQPTFNQKMFGVGSKTNWSDTCITQVFVIRMIMKMDQSEQSWAALILPEDVFFKIYSFCF